MPLQYHLTDQNFFSNQLCRFDLAVPHANFIVVFKPRITTFCSFKLFSNNLTSVDKLITNIVNQPRISVLIIINSGEYFNLRQKQIQAISPALKYIRQIYRYSQKPEEPCHITGWSVQTDSSFETSLRAPKSPEILMFACLMPNNVTTQQSLIALILPNE